LAACGGSYLVAAVLWSSGCTRAPSSCEKITNAASNGVPSDAQVGVCFRDERAAFDRLRDIVSAEPRAVRLEREALDGCGKTGDCRAAGLEKGDAREVIQLMRATGASAVTRGPGGEVVFSIYERGLSTSGRSKGVEWRTRPPLRIVGDTDRDRSAHYELSYAKLDDGWYIAHSSN
jgi:hypothetical protein